MRIYDNRLGRFLSTDPLTKSYPMLTPYQFASNRPIDGIDLDGKEWMKTEHYDPKTGITNVHFQVKLKIENASKLDFNMQEMKDEIHSQFKLAFSKSSNSNTNFTSSIEFEDVAKIDSYTGFGVFFYDREIPSKYLGFSASAINTKVNVFSVAVGEFNAENPDKIFPLQGFDIKDFAQTVIHELGHTAGVKHPMDPNGASDVQLEPNIIIQKPKGGQQVVDYKPAINAVMNLIIENIMVYGSTPLNGKKIKDHEPDAMKRGNFSPDQIKVIQKQIESDEK